MFFSSYRRKTRKVRRDYQRQNTPNPFFRRRPKVRPRHHRLWVALGGVAVFIGLIWFFLAAPFWRIQDLRISGLSRVPESDLERIIYNQTLTRHGGLFSESNIFLFNSRQVRQKIITAYNLADLKITKIWPHTLAVAVSERPYAFIYQEGSALYYASGDGHIIRQPAVNPADQKKYFTIENQGGETLISASDELDIAPAELNFITELQAALSAYPDLPVDHFIIDSELNTVKVKFQNGPLAYFNTQDSVTSQVNILHLVKNAKIKDNFSKTNYIDLRYGNRVFISPDFNN